MWAVYEFNAHGVLLRKSKFSDHNDANTFFDEVAIKRCNWVRLSDDDGLPVTEAVRWGNDK